MSDLTAEKTITRLVAYGSALITIFILSGSVTDPVNVTKLLILGAVGTGIFGVVLKSFSKAFFLENKYILIIVSLFLISAVNSALFSNLPFAQNLYGAYGRNSGLLTYIFLAMALIGALSIRQYENLKIIVYALALAGTLNALYSLWVISFGDFVGWVNPYGNILGTLGNPNFIGAFLGMFFSVVVAYIFDSRFSIGVRIALVVLAAITFFEIYNSNAIQGRVVAALGIGVVLFLYLRSKFNRVVTVSYSILAVTIGAIASLGALQIGPLTQYIYKYSVSLRGQYWLAGWNTGEAHPLHGVGMDGFGDWYRRMRDIQALTTPGVNTIVNAAHNVFIDMFAFGGWPLFLTYTLIVILGGFSIVSVIIRVKTYDPVFTALAVAWLGYQAQSLISINQIGLAIWGWVLTGALLAYARNLRNSDLEASSAVTKMSGKNQTNKSLNSVISSGLVAGVGIVLGGILASPPVASDMKWRTAQLARTANSLEAALSTSYMNPANSMKYLMSIQTFESSSLPDLSHKYALEAVKFNPDSFELWRALYFIQASTAEEKLTALENMRRLDPLNPDVTTQ